ncbi:hypothetical protein Tco_0711689 [Tanacetum coccineum]
MVRSLRREVSPAPIHNIYTFYESESSESDTKNVDIENLTLVQYFALDQKNTRIRFTFPDDSTFEIKGQLLRELRVYTYTSIPSNSRRNRLDMVRKNIDRMYKELELSQAKLHLEILPSYDDIQAVE